MKLRLLSYLGAILGISFKVEGVPHGAPDRRATESAH